MRWTNHNLIGTLGRGDTIARMIRSIVFALALSLGAHAAGVTFTAPAAWKPVPTSSSMRVAQYALPHAAGDSQEAELVVY